MHVDRPGNETGVDVHSQSIDRGIATYGMAPYIWEGGKQLAVIVKDITVIYLALNIRSVVVIVDIYHNNFSRVPAHAWWALPSLGPRLSPGGGGGGGGESLGPRLYRLCQLVLLYRCFARRSFVGCTRI